MTEIVRTFFDLEEKQVDAAEESAVLRRMGFGKQSDWDDLLKSRIVVILAEAQSGKTYECQAQQEKMWEAGEAAFFVDLASVGGQPWCEIRSPEEDERLERWRRSTETLTIFLDSVDELKLTQRRFQTALRNVANDLDNQMHRVRVVLTSRPLPVDRDVFLKTFAARGPENVPSETDFARLMTGKRTPERAAEALRDVRYVSLLPLTERDIEGLARLRGVIDTDAFLAGLRSTSMLEFMLRPQDVIEAASAWQELGRRFGTHAEQVAFDIRARLKPNPDRRDRPLEDDRALEGAKRLALAVALTRRLTIRHDVNNDPGDASTVLEPAEILGDWRDDDRRALLERGLFGFSTYGRVRFHNRLAFEFLAAERLSDLIDKGLSRKAVRRLLVVQTAQGADVVRPSLREVTAWLALRQGWVFEFVNRLEPALLMNLGDPGSLTVEQRQAVLVAYVERYGPGGWRGMHVPEIQVHRFAHSSLATVINERFAQVENGEVRQTLLDLIAQGRLHDCAHLARGVIWKKDVDRYERHDALEALVALGDPDLRKVIGALVDGPDVWNNDFARLVVYRLFPGWMTVEELLAILAWLPETKSTGSELSRNVPALIADLSTDQLRELRDGLAPLVEAGLRFDEVSHAAAHDRPHLVAPLAAVGAGLLAADASSPDDARPIALATNLSRSARSDEDVPSRLAGELDRAPPALRSAIFGEDVLLLRRLQPGKARLDLFMDVVWRGSLRIGPDDEPWLREMLADRSASGDLRAAALLMHIFAIGSQEPDELRSLKPCVADDAELAEFVENRLKPSAPSRQQRRYLLCNKRRKRQRERREAKTTASWTMFWRRLRDNPDRAFAPDQVEQTAWDLWQVMRRGQARSRSSGWDRQLLDKHLGPGVADRLRTALIPVWRREWPPLTSEMPVEEQDRMFERWVLALAAIQAEAEDPSWIARLTAEDAERAVRYVSVVCSDFPPWLADIAGKYGNIVDRVLGNELSWSLSRPPFPHGRSIILQHIHYAVPEVARLFLPRLRAWLAETGGLPADGDDLQGSANRLEQVLETLLKFGGPTDRSMIAAAASSAFLPGSNQAFARVWLPALFEVDPRLGVERLEVICGTAGVGRDNEAVAWMADLFGGLRRGEGVNLRRPEMTPALLLRLLRLSYRHVEPADDEVHEGSFSPNRRDTAETGRNMLLEAVLNLGGAEGWRAKQEIAADPLFMHLRDRLHALALDRSAREADDLVMRPADVARIENGVEPGPRTPAEMFALMTDRLDDLRDHLLGDTSPREMWAGVSDERVMRRAIAERLEETARGAYTVPQEQVTAEEKETDIRLRSAVGSIEGVIELKIGDKEYSAADLVKRIADQLVSKYLAPAGRRAGVLLITRAVRTIWHHPQTGAKIDFEQMLALLREEARSIQQRFPDEIHIDVVGLDLMRRLPTEKAARRRQ